MRGFAIQFRVNAEDPQNNFLPSFGKITRYYAPGGPGIRTDAAIYSGYNIPPYYDSMCAKLVCWALTWEEVVARSQRALRDMGIYGIRSTIPYYLEIIQCDDFHKGNFDTSFVETHPELTEYSVKHRPWLVAAAIAAAIGVHTGL
jgi:pyruvate carboxylase subunit A